MNSLRMRQKLDGVRKTVCHKTRYLIYRCISNKLEYMLKLYSREIFSTIDRYKNGENAYIYSKQQQQQNRDTALNTSRLHGFWQSAATVSERSCNLWQMQSNSWQFRGRIDVPLIRHRNFPLWWRRCLTTTNYLNNCFIGIEDGPANSAPLRYGRPFALPPRLAERPDG